jgi:hypothetical protein
MIFILSKLTNISDLHILAISGALVSAVGLPLFFLSIRKAYGSKLPFSINTLIGALIFFMVLNSSYLHLIEVNNFYINPYTQGATNANLAAMIFMFGYLLKNRSIKIFLIFLSFSFHVSTGFFFSLILYSKKLWSTIKLLERKIGKFKLVLLVLLQIVIFSFLVFNLNEENKTGWEFYILNRAPHHYVVDSNLETATWLPIIYSLITVAIVGSQFVSRKYVYLIFLFSFVVVLSALGFAYALPFLIALIIIIFDFSSILHVGFVVGTLSLLLALQTSQVSAISNFFSVFIPGTRYVSFVMAYLFAIACSRIFEKFPALGGRSITIFNNRILTTIYTLLLFGCLVASFDLIARSSIKSFDEIKVETERIFPIPFSNDELIIPIGVDTTGWREFANANIYIDDFVIWSNLNEYARRNQLVKEIEKDLSSGDFRGQEYKLIGSRWKSDLKVLFIFNRTAKFETSNMDCSEQEIYIICTLERVNLAI